MRVSRFLAIVACYRGSLNHSHKPKREKGFVFIDQTTTDSYSLEHGPLLFSLWVKLRPTEVLCALNVLFDSI